MNERMGNRLGGDERMRHNPALQIGLAADDRLVDPDQGVARHQKQSLGIAKLATLPGERNVLQPRKAAGDFKVCALFMRRQFAPRIQIHDDPTGGAGLDGICHAVLVIHGSARLSRKTFQRAGARQVPDQARPATNRQARPATSKTAPKGAALRFKRDAIPRQNGSETSG